ncbi:MAG: hypothetical protein JNK05_16060 [Myxococcales bacterium]|nr:hypothetical protein [Myxococcales bacterium]
MNPTLFPETSAYIAALPDGMDSFAQCEVKGSVVRQLIDGFDRSILHELPEASRALIEAPPPVSAWVREVPVNVMLLVTGEHLVRTTGRRDAMNERAYEASKQLLSTPLYKILFLVVSPERLVSGVDRRWNALRRGTRLELLSHSPHSAHLRAHMPEGLYTRGLLELRASSMRAALDCAGGRRSKVTLDALTKSAVDFMCSWE